MIIDLILLAIFAAIIATVIWLSGQEGETRTHAPPDHEKKPVLKNLRPAGSDESSRVKPV